LLLLLAPSIAFARTSYWGEYEAEASRLIRDQGDVGLTNLLGLAVDAIANDARWTGTRKQAHDLFRNYLATAVGITPPANWDADVTDAQDVAVDLMTFMDRVVVNNRRLTQASKDAILDFARTNAEFEPQQ
jgi:hypothetical protein